MELFLIAGAAMMFGCFLIGVAVGRISVFARDRKCKIVHSIEGWTESLIFAGLATLAIGVVAGACLWIYHPNDLQDRASEILRHPQVEALK